MGRKLSTEIEQKFIDKYYKYKSICKVAKDLGVSDGWVSKILKRNGVKTYPIKGRKHTPETIAEYKRVRNTKEWIEKTCTLARNRKISETRRIKYGTKSKDKKYLKNLIRKSAEYKKWRKAVFERDNYTCQICGKRSKTGCSVYLEADHILSFEYYPALRFDVCNGRTLCQKCHRKSHNFGVKVWQKSKCIKLKT